MTDTSLWSRLIQRDIVSLLFFLPPQAWRTWSGLCSSTPRGCPMARVAVDHPTVNGNNPVTGYRLPLQFNTTTTSSTSTQLQTTLSLQMNKPTFLLKPFGAALRLKTTQKKQVSTIQRNIHKQLYNSLMDTRTEQAILLSQSTSHTGAHFMQPSSEAYEAEDRCFRVSVARRLMLPHPAASHAADVVQFCPNTNAAGVICNKPVDPQQHHCHGCRYGGGVDRMPAAVGRCLADVINHKVAQRYL